MPAGKTPVRPPTPDAIADAAAILARGGLVAFPTETVYGLGAHALDPAAVRRIFEAKGRPAHDPLIVHVTSLDAAVPLVTAIPRLARALAERFWPGPLTLVLPRSARVPDAVTAGLDTVAIRVPAHPVARALLEAAQLPVAAPSANLFSRPSPTQASHVADDLDGSLDLILDGGATTVGVESTVVDLTRGGAAILRPGALTIEMLRAVAPAITAAPMQMSGAAPMASPGLLDRHYSPRAPLTLYRGSRVVDALVDEAGRALARGRRVGIVGTDEVVEAVRCSGLDVRAAALGPSHDLATIAKRLYAALRELDASGVELILAAEIGSEDGLGSAVRDRLRRAAAGGIVDTA